MTIDEWVRDAALRLAKAGVESSLLEARLLAAHALDRDKMWVMANGNLATFNEEQLESALLHRLSRFPLAYITGWKEFYGRDFAVDTAVLIPRPETELLVDVALERLRHGSRLLDLGAGSGCVGITLKLERPDVRIVGADISQEALAVAERNAERLDAHLDWVWSDGFNSLEGEMFDMIVTNPPYVETNADLEPEVSEWEPASALFAGPDGLSFYRRLAQEAGTHVNPEGWLLMELGAGQRDAVTELFRGPGRKLQSWEDLAGIPRVLGVQFS